jgi:hypothetical protein
MKNEKGAALLDRRQIPRAPGIVDIFQALSGASVVDMSCFSNQIYRTGTPLNDSIRRPSQIGAG